MEGYENVPVTLYNLSGQKVFSAQVINGEVQLPALSSGVYAVKIGTQGSTLIRL
ncbi:MAG: T9SS type A sorting domain-containing protein [Prevotella sp.]|nr:T9SS type A sorting domain-containing protein [Prevotella sp.]